jgi:hypothetical protein
MGAIMGIQESFILKWFIVFQSLGTYMFLYMCIKQFLKQNYPACVCDFIVCVLMFLGWLYNVLKVFGLLDT